MCRGQSLKEFFATTTPLEVELYAVYATIEPFGSPHLDALATQQAYYTVAPHINRHVSPQDFLPPWAKKPIAPEQQAILMDAWAETWNQAWKETNPAA